ncbi:unnamed protein product [Dovyalis caffra]|uniref:Uncharacterized protein n=1 Tax=Dovyalis caffra TaxID=77055 RepID=A0AAV1S942_9ROSI|nr:unnamed protein product [Dovyalis caffra]
MKHLDCTHKAILSILLKPKATMLNILLKRRAEIRIINRKLPLVKDACYMQRPKRYPPLTPQPQAVYNGQPPLPPPPPEPSNSSDCCALTYVIRLYNMRKRRECFAR